MTRRRSLLLLLLSALLLGDLLFLGWRWHRDAMPNAFVTRAGFDAGRMPADATALRFQGGQWTAGGRRVRDVAAYAKALDAGRYMLLVETGSYGSFVAAIRDLKAHGVCHILVRDPDMPAAPMLYAGNAFTLSGFILCGFPNDDMGYYGPLPDGPIHVPPAPSLR
jgi:hypothetical protein